MCPEAVGRGRKRSGGADAATAVDVSVCVVNWNSRELLRRCLESLLEQPQGARLEVIVVDNGSTDGAPAMVAARFPQVRLVCNRDNRGYAAACNQAAARASGDYLLFLNNDTEVPPHTLGRLVELARRYPEGGLFGPRLRTPAGNWQVSHRRRPHLAALLHKVSWLRWTGWFRGRYRHYRHGPELPPQPCEVVPVEVLLGAAVLVPRPLFWAVGGFDEQFRFGVEDIDLSVRIGQQAAVYFVPGVEIVHHGRAASRHNIGFVAPSVATGYVQYLRKTGTSRWALALYKLAVCCDAPLVLVYKCVEGAVQWLAGRRAAARRSWLAVCGTWAFVRRELPRFWRA